MTKKWTPSSEIGWFQHAGITFDENILSWLNTIFSFVFGIACAYIASYHFFESWGKADGWIEDIFCVLKSPTFYLIVSCIGIITTQFFQNSRHKTMLQENKRVKALAKALNHSQEENLCLQSEKCSIYEQLVVMWLKGASKELSLDTHCRVTIYYENNEDFSVLARYSSNPVFTKIHKQKFALNQEDGLCPSLKED